MDAALYHGDRWLTEDYLTYGLCGSSSKRVFQSKPNGEAVISDLLHRWVFCLQYANAEGLGQTFFQSLNLSHFPQWLISPGSEPKGYRIQLQKVFTFMGIGAQGEGLTVWNEGSFPM